ncbi:aldo/keto reductase [bacterium]|nr:aldo/keto reductase [bacterium]
MAPKLAIGTASFGLNYGIAGLRKVRAPSVRRILATAALNRIDLLDTAHEYGNALDVLGRFSDLIEKQKFRIVLKIPKIPTNVRFDQLEYYRDLIFSDLEKLRLPSVDTLMVHNDDVMLGKSGELVYDLLLSMRQWQICDKIGISVYDPRVLKNIIDGYHFDVVQFPTNIVDQRFLDLGVDYMSACGIEMHARSLFLQGLLLLPPEGLKHISRFHLVKIRAVARKFGGNMLKACLTYFRQQFPINYGVVGVHSVEQLQEIINVYNSINVVCDFDQYAINDKELIDPREWKIG